MKNGQFSSGKKTKHIKAKFFFIKDRVDDREMRVIDCLSENMWADVLTKPLQGMAFKRMQVELMNCSVDYEENDERETTLHTKSLSERGQILSQTPQECVEGSRKSYLGKDRRIVVSRIRKRSKPPVQKKGRE
jgi:hypothetical protein